MKRWSIIQTAREDYYLVQTQYIFKYDEASNLICISDEDTKNLIIRDHEWHEENVEIIVSHDDKNALLTAAHDIIAKRIRIRPNRGFGTTENNNDKTIQEICAEIEKTARIARMKTLQQKVNRSKFTPGREAGQCDEFLNQKSVPTDVRSQSLSTSQRSSQKTSGKRRLPSTSNDGSSPRDENSSDDDVSSRLSISPRTVHQPRASQPTEKKCIDRILHKLVTIDSKVDDVSKRLQVTEEKQTEFEKTIKERPNIRQELNYERNNAYTDVNGNRNYRRNHHLNNLQPVFDQNHEMEIIPGHKLKYQIYVDAAVAKTMRRRATIIMKTILDKEQRSVLKLRTIRKNEDANEKFTADLRKITDICLALQDYVYIECSSKDNIHVHLRRWICEYTGNERAVTKRAAKNHPDNKDANVK